MLKTAVMKSQWSLLKSTSLEFVFAIIVTD